MSRTAARATLDSEIDVTEAAPVPWLPIAIGSGAAMFLCMALGRFSYSAMIPALVEAGLLNSVAAGYVGGVNMVGFLTGAAVSTMLARRWRLDRLLLACLAVAVAALWASAVPWGALWLGGWRAAIGMATGLVMVLGLAAAAQTAPRAKRTFAMTTIFVGVGTGILFGATAVPLLLSISLEAAWIGIALAGTLAAAVAVWGWTGLARIETTPPSLADAGPPAGFKWTAIVVASLLFSFGIVPHTIYWFDFIARDLNQGYAVASLHWTGVGIFAILGPLLAAWLAARTGTARAIAIVYLVMTAGIVLPWASQIAPALIASTMIFGAQPAISALLGARARDLGSPQDMQRMMRAIILSNAVGSAAGGIMVPMLLAETGSYEVLFLAGGLAFAVASLLLLPAALASEPMSPETG